MSEKRILNDQTLQKNDLDTILKVNEKAVELHNEVAEQYEELISLGTGANQKLEQLQKDTNEIKDEIKEISKNQFKLMILIASGILGLLVQIISLLLKK